MAPELIFPEEELAVTIKSKINHLDLSFFIPSILFINENSFHDKPLKLLAQPTN